MFFSQYFSFPLSVSFHHSIVYLNFTIKLAENRLLDTYQFCWPHLMHLALNCLVLLWSSPHFYQPWNKNTIYLLCSTCLWSVKLKPGNMKHTRLRLASNYQLNAHFLYSITIYMLHYSPPHVSSSTLLILRRTNCIVTASAIVTLHKQPYSMQVESGLQSALHLHTVLLFTEGDDTRGCGDKICPPENEQHAARNVWRVIM